MISMSLRRYVALASLVLLSSVGLRAQSFWGPTYVDFDALGYSSYNLVFYADVVVGGSSYATAYASYGSLYETSYSYIGEAGVGMYFYNIQKIKGQWVAETAGVYAFSNATGQYEYTFYNNLPLPSAAYVYGNAECDGYQQTVRGQIVPLW